MQIPLLKLEWPDKLGEGVAFRQSQGLVKPQLGVMSEQSKCACSLRDYLSMIGGGGEKAFGC